jgi:hypothetical protein
MREAIPPVPIRLHYALGQLYQRHLYRCGISQCAHRFRDYYIKYLKYDHRQNVQRLTDLCRTLYIANCCEHNNNISGPMKCGAVITQWSLLCRNEL